LYLKNRKEEQLFTPLHPEGVVLDLHSPLGKLIIALRDYAHHFAISYQRLLASKRAL
jgi:excinuclease UvrABC nuclease subunit